MRLLLQIVYEDGRACRFPAGGPIEANLVDMLAKELTAIKWYNRLFKYDKTVRNSIRTSLLEFKKNGRIIASQKQ